MSYSWNVFYWWGRSGSMSIGLLFLGCMIFALLGVALLSGIFSRRFDRQHRWPAGIFGILLLSYGLAAYFYYPDAWLEGFGYDARQRWKENNGREIILRLMELYPIQEYQDYYTHADDLTVAFLPSSLVNLEEIRVDGLNPRVALFSGQDGVGALVSYYPRGRYPGFSVAFSTGRDPFEALGTSVDRTWRIKLLMRKPDLWVFLQGSSIL